MSRRSERARRAREAQRPDAERAGGERAREAQRPDAERARGERAGGAPPPADAQGSRRQAPAGRSGRRGASWGLGLQLAFLVAVLAGVTLIADLAGAANLGVALGIGQIAFAIAVVFLLTRR